MIGVAPKGDGRERLLDAIYASRLVGNHILNERPDVSTAKHQWKIDQVVVQGKGKERSEEVKSTIKFTAFLCTTYAAVVYTALILMLPLTFFSSYHPDYS